MNQIMATYENGVLKPDQPLDLPQQARVRLTVEPIETVTQSDDEAWEEMERLWDEVVIDSGGNLMTRDELHERR